MIYWNRGRSNHCLSFRALPGLTMVPLHWGHLHSLIYWLLQLFMSCYFPCVCGNRVLSPLYLPHPIWPSIRVFCLLSSGAWHLYCLFPLSKTHKTCAPLLKAFTILSLWPDVNRLLSICRQFNYVVQMNILPCFVIWGPTKCILWTLEHSTFPSTTLYR